MYAKGNHLVRKFKSCSEDVKLKLFRVYCNVLYCSTVWSNYSESCMRKLAIAHKRIFRNLLNIRVGSISYAMINKECDPLPVILRKLTNGFRNRLMGSENVIIQALIKSTYFCDSSIFKQWQKRLFSM